MADCSKFDAGWVFGKEFVWHLSVVAFAAGAVSPAPG
jgi:hypothetical protein